MKSKEDIKDFLLVLLRVVVALGIFIAAMVYYDELTNIDIRALVQAAPSVLAAVFLVWAVYLIKSLVFVVPASLIYVSVGMAFPPLTACIINIIGIALEVAVTYWLGNFLGSEAVEKILRKKKGGEKLLNMKLQDKASFILTVRFLPVFPIDFASLFFGAFSKKFFKYFFLSVLGIAPRVILFTIIGDGIYDWIPMTLIIKICIAAIPVALIVYLIKHYKKRGKQNETAV